MLNIDLLADTTAALQPYLPFDLPPQIFYFANCNALKGPTDTRMPEGFHPLGSCSFLILTSSCLSVESFAPSQGSRLMTIHVAWTCSVVRAQTRPLTLCHFATVQQVSLGWGLLLLPDVPENLKSYLPSSLQAKRLEVPFAVSSNIIKREDI